jgi:hypothetical protein
LESEEVEVEVKDTLPLLEDEEEEDEEEMT